MNDQHISQIRTALVLATEAVMAPEQREAFLANIHRLNPQMRGAQVADVLDILADMDANLEVTEDERYSAVYDACEAAWGETIARPGFGSMAAGYALYALLYASGEAPAVEAAIDLGTRAIKAVKEAA